MRFTLEKTERLITLFLPITVIGPVFLNIMAFVVDGHRHETFRLAFVLGIEGFVALLFLFGVCLLWKQSPAFRRQILCTLLIPVLMGGVFLWAVCIWSGKAYLLKELFVNECYLVSICCAVLLVWSGKKQAALLKGLCVYGAIISPVILYYCVRLYLPGANYNMISLGNINYMSLAYLLMEFCFFLFLCNVLLEDHNHLWLQRIGFLMFILFCAAIALSGTKGAMLCLLWGLFLTAIYLKRTFPNEAKRKWLLYPAAAFVTIALFTTVLFPYLGAENRFVIFLKEITSPETVNVADTDIQKVTEILSKVEVAKEEGAPSDKTGYTDSDIISAITSEEVQEGLEEDKITQEEYDILTEVGQTLNETSTGGRKYYWNCALNEIRKAPLTGQGPLFFWYTYGSYPHNLFLEAATDFGLLFTCVLFLFGAYTFIRLFRRSAKSPWIAIFFLYVLMYLPQKLVSGTLYDFSTFFQYGFCVIFAFLPERYVIPKGDVNADLS